MPHSNHQPTMMTNERPGQGAYRRSLPGSPGRAVIGCPNGSDGVQRHTCPDQRTWMRVARRPQPGRYSRYVIALDTNTLRGLSFPGDAALSMLAALARHTSHKLVLSEVVLDEYLSFRRREREEHRMAAAKAIKSMIRSAWWPGRDEWAKLPLPDVDQDLIRIEEDLRRTFEVLPLDGASAIEGLRREAYRRPPANLGSSAGGARDAAAWVSLVDWCKTHPDVPTYFVSSDKDFVHPDLSNERPANLRVVNEMDSVLAELAAPSHRPVDIELCLPPTRSGLQQATSFSARCSSR